MVQAILFDLDDTLIKTYETKKEPLKELGRKFYSIELSDEDIKKNWGKPVGELVRSLFGEVDVNEAIENYTKLRSKFPTVAYEQTVTTLRKLSENYLLGIVTSKSSRYLDQDLSLAEIPKEMFFTLQTEEDTMFHKPDPRVFDNVMEILDRKGVEESAVIYVGDTLFDFYAARDRSIRFYGLPDRTTDMQLFKNEGAETLVSIEDLLTLPELSNPSTI